MKVFPVIYASLIFAVPAAGAILEEEDVLGVAGFQHAGSLSEIVCLSDGVHVLSSSRDHCVRLWEIKSGKLIRTFTKEKVGSMWGIRLLPGDTEFLAAGGSGEILRFEVATGKMLMAYKHSDTAYRIALHPDGKRFVGTDDNGAAILWELETGKQIRSFDGHSDDVYTAIFIKDGTQLITGSSDGTFRVWDVETGKCLETKKKFKDVYTIALSPDGKRFAMASDDDCIRVFEVGTLKEVWKVKLKEDAQVVSWSPNGKTIATASDDENLYVFNAEDGEEVLKIAVANSNHTPITFTTDGKTLISGGDNILHLHDVSTGERIVPTEGIPEAPGGFGYAVIASGGRRIVSAKSEKVFVWNRDFEEAPIESEEKEDISSLAISQDSQHFALGDDKGMILVRKVENQTQVTKMIPGSKVNALAFLPEGKGLVSGGRDDKITQWDLDGKKIRSYKGHEGEINDIAVSSDGGTIASVSHDYSVRLWSTETGGELIRMKVEKDRPEAVAIIDQGRSVIAALDEPEVWGRFLKPIARKLVLDLKEVGKFAEQLADSDFAVRQKATESLAAMGREVLSPLEALAADDPEVSSRIAGVKELILGVGGSGGMKIVHKFKNDFNMIAGDPKGRYWAGTVGWGGDAQVVVGEVKDQKLIILETLKTGRGVRRVSFSPDGGHLVTTNADGTLSIYRVTR